MSSPEILAPFMDLIDEKLSSVTTDYAGHYAAYRDSLRTLEQELVDKAGARFGLSNGALTMRLAGVSTTCTSGLPGLLRNWLNSARRKIEMSGCPGHVASRRDTKVCRLCGIHIDDLRPDDDGFNPFGSGPVPIEAREG